MADIKIEGTLSDKNFGQLPALKANDVVKFTITAKVTALDALKFELGDTIEIEEPSIMVQNPQQKVFVNARNLK